MCDCERFEEIANLLDWFAPQSGHVTPGIRGKIVISGLTSGPHQPSGHTSAVMAGHPRQNGLWESLIDALKRCSEFNTAQALETASAASSQRK